MHPRVQWGFHGNCGKTQLSACMHTCALTDLMHSHLTKFYKPNWLKITWSALRAVYNVSLQLCPREYIKLHSGYKSHTPAEAHVWYNYYLANKSPTSHLLELQQLWTYRIHSPLHQCHQHSPVHHHTQRTRWYTSHQMYQSSQSYQFSPWGRQYIHPCKQHLCTTEIGLWWMFTLM